MKIFNFTIVIIILLSLLEKSIAQTDDLNWAPIGAVWNYIIPSITGGSSSYNLIAVKDTVIEGKLCRKMQNDFGNVRIFFHTQGDSVLHYTDDQFKLLYDFSARAGDTIKIDYSDPICEKEVVSLVVDSTGAIIRNNDTLTVQWISQPFLDQTCGIGFITGIIIEKIGALGFLIPEFIQGDPFAPSGALNCYSDTLCTVPFNVSAFANSLYNYNTDSLVDFCVSGITCDTLVSVLKPLGELQGVSLFPSPAKDLVTLESTQFPIQGVSIYDLSGRLVFSSTIDSIKGKLDIEISHLPRGLFFLQAQIQGNLYIQKIHLIE